jgi:hypothetical protein
VQIWTSCSEAGRQTGWLIASRRAGRLADECAELNNVEQRVRRAYSNNVSVSMEEDRQTRRLEKTLSTSSNAPWQAGSHVVLRAGVGPEAVMGEGAGAVLGRCGCCAGEGVAGASAGCWGGYAVRS